MSVLVAHLRFLAALLRTGWRSTLALRGAFAFQAVAMAANNVIFFVMWVLLLRRYEHVGGWRLPDVAVLYGMLATIVGLAVVLGNGARTISTAVVEGHLDVVLTRPKAALVQILPSRMLASGYGDVASGIAMLALSGRVGWGETAPVLLGCLAGVVVLLSTSVLVHSLAFWIGPAEGVTQPYEESLIAFSTYPEPIASGGALRTLLFTAVPAGFVGWMPASLVRAFAWPRAAAACLGAAGFATLAIAVFRAGIRRYESGNRIGLAP